MTADERAPSGAVAAAGTRAAAGVPPLAVWVNGELQPAGAAHVSARDRGFTLADGVFETMRLRHGRLFRLEEHTSRLLRGLHALDIAPPDGLREWLGHAVSAWTGDEGAVRLTVTRGIGAGGLSPVPHAVPTVVIAVGPMPGVLPSVYENGLTSRVAGGRRNQRAVTAGLKTLAYTDAIAALIEAQRAGADEALFLDTDDHCSEASASNLFAVIGGTLVTPPVECGALPGVTRAAVMEIALALGLHLAERPFGLDDLYGAAEAFLTSSLRGVAPLVHVGARPLAQGRPGPVTARVRAAYDDLVRRECAT